MTTSNQSSAMFTQRFGNKLESRPAQTSTRPAPASQKSGSFVAALVRALSAFAV